MQTLGIRELIDKEKEKIRGKGIVVRLYESTLEEYLVTSDLYLNNDNYIYHISPYPRLLRFRKSAMELAEIELDSDTVYTITGRETDSDMNELIYYIRNKCPWLGKF